LRKKELATTYPPCYTISGKSVEWTWDKRKWYEAQTESKKQKNNLGMTVYMTWKYFYYCRNP